MHSRTNKTVEAHAISGKILNLSETVLASGMLLNPIPYVPDTLDQYTLQIYFSIIAILTIVFITSTPLSLKYNSHRGTIGKILVAVGIAEILPFFYGLAITHPISTPYLLLNPLIVLLTLGSITMVGGVLNIRKAGTHWFSLLIILATSLVTSAFIAYFLM